MVTVYRKATVTIFAMASKGSKDGIFRPPQEDSLRSKPPATTLPVFSRGTKDETQVWIGVHNLPRERLRDMWKRYPLSTRAWAFQELLLSPRHLYYGEQQLHWRCLQCTRSADGLPVVLLRERYYEKLFDASHHIHSKAMSSHLSGSGNINRVLNVYYALIENYSCRKLTFSADKLPALSGLVELFRPAIGGDYFAGIWLNDFKRGLLWCALTRAGNFEAAVHVSPYRAPSWSWAVTDDPVRFPPIEPLESPWNAQLVGHQVVLQDPSNPYGQVKSGHLNLRVWTRVIVHNNYETHRPSSAVLDRLECDLTRSGRRRRRRHALIRGSAYFDEGPCNKYAQSIIRDKDSGQFVLLTINHEDAVTDIAGDEEDIDLDSHLTSRQEHLAVIIQESGPSDRMDLRCLTLRKNDKDGNDDVYIRTGFLAIEGQEPSMKGWKLQNVTII